MMTDTRMTQPPPIGARYLPEFDINGCVQTDDGRLIPIATHSAQPAVDRATRTVVPRTAWERQQEGHE